MFLLDRKIDELLHLQNYFFNDMVSTTISSKKRQTVADSVRDTRIKGIPKEIVYHITNMQDIKTFDPYTEFAKQIGFITDFEITSHRIPELGMTKFLSNMGINTTNNLTNVLDLFWKGSGARKKTGFAIKSFRDMGDSSMALQTWLYNEFQFKEYYKEDGFNFKAVLNDMELTNACVNSAETTAKRYIMEYITNDDKFNNRRWSEYLLDNNINNDRWNENVSKIVKPSNDEINELYRIYLRNTDQ